MSYTYTSLEPGNQVIHSEKPIDYLEGLARWVRTEGDKPAEVPENPATEDVTGDSDAEKPHANANKAEWVAYAESKGLNVDGLTVAEIKELVED